MRLRALGVALTARAAVATTPAALTTVNIVGAAFLTAFPAPWSRVVFAFTSVSSLNIIKDVVLPADLAELLL